MVLSLLTIWLVFTGIAVPAGATPTKGYQQTNLISDGSVDAATVNANFINPWGISIGTDFWINTTGSGLDYVVSSAGDISFSVTIPPATGAGLGKPTGTLYTGNVPSGSFLLPDKSAPLFLFCTLDGTVSGWSGGSVMIALNNGADSDVYTGMALLTTGNGTFVLLANAGAAGDVQAYNGKYQRVMQGKFSDPNVPSNYAPFGVHVINGTVYVAFAPRRGSDHLPVVVPGDGFVDAFDETGKFLSRVIPAGGKLNNPWGMALAPATFGQFGGDLLVGNFGDGTISAYDPTTYAFKGQLADGSGNLFANPGLWEIVFGQASPAVGDPNTLYFAAGINHEHGGLYGTFTVATSASTATTTTVISDGNPQNQAVKVTFTALVQPKTGTGEPEGTVAFTVDGKALATAPVDSTAHATASSSALTVGSHAIKATYSGDTNFTTSSGTLTETINTPTTASPAFSPAAGSYTTVQTVSISDATPHASIYYTTNGTTPSKTSTLYSKALSIATTTTLKAIAMATGLANSGVASATYTINLNTTAAPTFTPAAGTFIATQSVTLADTSTGAVIHFTTDGSTPTTASATYSKAISVTKTTTVRALAQAPGLAPSAVVSATFTISAPTRTATPTFGPPPGTYSSAQYVYLYDTTSGAVVHYTTNGTTPTATSPVYSGTVYVASSMTIEALAIAPGAAASSVAVGVYTISSGGGGGGGGGCGYYCH